MEGNEAFAGELAKLFQEGGYEVCGITDDGAEGLKIMSKHSPSVAVMSLLLKNLDGFSVMEEAKREQRKTDFIVLGNFSDDKIINRVINLGARYYLMKPVSASVVYDRAAEIAEVQLSARGNQNGGCRPAYYQQCDEGTLSRDRGEVCDLRQQGRARDTPRHRGGLEQRSHRRGERHLRRARIHRDGKAHEQRIYRPCCR